MRAGSEHAPGHRLLVGNDDAPVVRLALVGRDHGRRARAERAIGEDLLPADADPVVAKAPADARLVEVLDPGVVDVLDHAQAQLPALAQALQGGQAVRPVEVVDARQAGAPQALLSLGHPAGQRFQRRARDQPGDGVHRRVFQQNAGRVACRIADEAAAGRVGRGGGDPGQAQGRAVGPGRVAALGLEIDGMARRDRIQIGGGGKGAIRPHILHPAAPGDPLAGRGAAGPLLHPAQGFLFARHFEQVDFLQGLGEPLEVQVGVGQAGQDIPPTQVIDGRPRPGQVAQGVISDGDDALADHGQRAGQRARRIEGVDAAVEQDAVDHGGGLTCPESRPARRAALPGVPAGCRPCGRCGTSRS